MKHKNLPNEVKRMNSTPPRKLDDFFILILRDPLLWVLTGFACTILTIVLTPYIFDRPGAVLVILFQGLLPFLVSLVAVAVLALKQRKESVRDINKLLLFYVALIIQFANLYFLLVIVMSPFGKPFDGISFQDVSLNSDGWRLSFYWSAFLTYVDCLHYSVVTTTTLGFGDITPAQWYTKLLTDVQVLTGLAIAVVGIGQYFSPASRANDDKREKVERDV